MDDTPPDTRELTLPVVRPDPGAPSPARYYMERLAPSGRRPQEHALRLAAALLGGGAIDTFPWSALRYEHVSALRAMLLRSIGKKGKPYSPATINRTLSAVRGVLREAWLLKQMEFDDYQRVAAVDGVRASDLLAGRALSTEEQEMVSAVIGREGLTGIRDRSLFAVLAGGALRRQELVGLDLVHYDRATGWLQFIGKRNKERRVPLSEQSREHLDAWLAARGDEPGPLFCPVTNGVVRVRRLTPQAVYAVCARCAVKAGVKPFTPHDLRRTGASEMIDSSKDILAVQKMLGHSDPKTTSRYDRRGDRAMQEVAGKTAMPLLAKPKRTAEE